MTTLTEGDYKVADLALAGWGRKEIELAEVEMPGLMALRAEFADARPSGAPHHGLAAHDHPDGRAHRDPHRARRRRALGVVQHLLDPGPRRRGRGRRAGRHHRRPRGVPVYAWKGETLDEYWWCTDQALRWPDGGGPNMILDDGGDATLLVHKGVEYEKAGAVPEATEDDPDEWHVIVDLLRRTIAERPTRWSETAAAIKGVTEETTTGVHRLYQMFENGQLLFPAINVNDSVTKSKFDNLYGCRHSLVDGINRATDVMLGGKVAVVCGYGEVGKGSAQSLRARAAGSSSPRSTRSAPCRPPWRATRSAPSSR